MTPARELLPRRDRYVRMVDGDNVSEVGAVVASRGCKHGCRHCPLPPVYDRAFYAIPVETVMADIAALVEGGVRHITFADPDFLNGPTHALRVGAALHEAFPEITFDYTAKIEHLCRHRDVVEQLQRDGSRFVVSAVESFNADALMALDKGHTREDALAVFAHFREIGLTIRPSLVPFTPWETLASYVDMLRCVETEGLVPNIDAVQYSIRLLVPPGSWLEKHESMTPHLGGIDPELFTHSWRHPDAAMDELQVEVAAVVEQAQADGLDAETAYGRVRSVAESAYQAAGGPAMTFRGVSGARKRVPRLTEAWFC